MPQAFALLKILGYTEIIIFYTLFAYVGTETASFTGANKSQTCSVRTKTAKNRHLFRMRIARIFTSGMLPLRKVQRKKSSGGGKKSKE